MIIVDVWNILEKYFYKTTIPPGLLEKSNYSKNLIQTRYRGFVEFENKLENLLNAAIVCNHRSNNNHQIVQLHLHQIKQTYQDYFLFNQCLNVEKSDEICREDEFFGA